MNYRPEHKNAEKLIDYYLRGHRLYLASQSPRRRELLAQIGLDAEVIPSDYVEVPCPHISELENHLKKEALSKAEGAKEHVREGLILAADTVVVFKDQVLGKPTDKKDARRMLRRLQGRWHDVYSGIALLHMPSLYNNSAVTRSRVKFHKLNLREINAYLDTSEPMDKAGAYGLQGIGGLIVAEVRGSYTNVVGLPLETLRHLLIEVVSWVDYVGGRTEKE